MTPEELLAAVQKLATAVLVELGEKSPPRNKAVPRNSTLRAEPVGPDAGECFQNCIAAMLRMRMADSNDGSGRLYAAACPDKPFRDGILNLADKTIELTEGSIDAYVARATLLEAFGRDEPAPTGRQKTK